MKNILSELTIEILQKCPNACEFCSSLSTRNAAPILPLEIIKRVGTQAKTLGLRTVCISGGEPLCHPDIIQILNFFYEHSIYVKFYTSGQVITNENHETAFTRWQLFPISGMGVIFGVHSTIPSIHDALVGRQGAYELSMSSLRKSIELGYYTEVHIVPNKRNLHSLKQTVSELLSWGVNRISFLRLVPQGFAKINLHNLLLTPDEKLELDNTLVELKNECDNEKLRFGIPFSGAINSPQKCSAGNGKLIIRYDGLVFPCEAFKDSRNSAFVLGDIRKDDLYTIFERSTSFPPLIGLKTALSNSETCPAQLLYK